MTDTEKLDLLISSMDKVNTISDQLEQLNTSAVNFNFIVHQLDSKVEKLDSRMASVETRVEKLDSRMASVESKVEKLDSQVEKLDSRMASVETKVEKLDSRMVNVETKVEMMHGEMVEMKSDMKTMKLIMENELRVNIQRVAEGHLDLSRKLHEVVKNSNEIEMLSVRVGMLESEVREIKRKIS